MQVACSLRTCASAGPQRPGAAQLNPARPLGAGLAGLVAGNAAAALGASAEPTPFAAGASDAAAAAQAFAKSLPAVELPSIDLSSINLPAVDMQSLDGLGIDSVDPLAFAAGAAIVFLPLTIAAIFGGDKGAVGKAVPAATALQALEADSGCLLLDIRSKAEAKEEGNPSLKGISKRGPLSLPYTVVDKEGEVSLVEGFGERVAATRGLDIEGKPLILLDGDGKLAAAAAKEIIAALPGKKVFYVAGGADAWRAADGPWREPVKFELPEFPDLSNLDLAAGVNAVVGGANKLVTEFNEAPSLTKGALAAAGVAGAGIFLFSQAELLFEVAGVIAAGQFLLKMVFADDREKTLTTIKKVADAADIPSLPQDLGKVAAAVLDDPTAGSRSGTQVLKVATPPAPAAAPAPKPVPVTPAAAAASSNGNGNGAAAPPAGSAAANAAEAKAWIAAWRAKQGASVSS